MEKCTECRACELRCSFVHFGVFNARKSGVRIVSNWPELARARVCIQCEDPECLPACPTEALVYTESGSITVLHDDVQRVRGLRRGLSLRRHLDGPAVGAGGQV